MLFGFQAFAGVGAYQNTTQLGLFEWIKCSTGLTCTKIGDKVQIVVNPATQPVTAFTRFTGWVPDSLSGAGSGTQINGTATNVYLTQIKVHNNATLTGIAIDNGQTVGTNKYVVALYNALGVLVASSQVSGTLTAGAQTYQKVPFITPYSAAGGAYWIGLTINGTTDSFVTIPAAGAANGLAGIIGSQTFGTPSATLALPTDFGANSGVISFTY